MILNNGGWSLNRRNKIVCIILQNYDLFIPFLTFLARILIRKFMQIRIRIRPGQKHAHPCGSGSGSGSETLKNCHNYNSLLFKCFCLDFRFPSRDSVGARHSHPYLQRCRRNQTNRVQVRVRRKNVCYREVLPMKSKVMEVFEINWN